MIQAKLIIDGRDHELKEAVTSVGRTPDNSISFPDDDRISRHHAEIEFRDGSHYLIDLGSSNGTAVNGVAIRGEAELKDGDRIVFGGSREAVFSLSDGSRSEDPAGSTTPKVTSNETEPIPGADLLSYEAKAAGNRAVYSGIDAVATAAGAPGGGSNPMILVAGVVSGLALVAVAATVAVYYSGGSTNCDARARIIRPEAGDSITGAVDVELDVTDPGCVAKAVIVIDDTDVAAAEPPAFKAVLDARAIPEFADGRDHKVTVDLIDETGVRIRGRDPILLAFDTRASAKPTPAIQIADANTNAGPQKQASVSLLEVQSMAQKLVAQFAGGKAYDLRDRQFLQEIQKRTAEFAVAGYSERAAAYRDVINVAFVREQNIDAPIGFILAMSRSKFDPTKAGNDEGLWRMDRTFVADNKYDGSCGSSTLMDKDQTCAARAAAAYMKALVLGALDGDPLYGVAAFGKTPADAAEWKTKLPANRSDIWRAIQGNAEREQLLRFLAAGIVTENPKRFGLDKDRPLSELYRITL